MNRYRVQKMIVESKSCVHFKMYNVCWFVVCMIACIYKSNHLWLPLYGVYLIISTSHNL